MTKTFISARQKKLYVIHLLDLKWSIKQFNMYRSSTNKLPWIVLQGDLPDLGVKPGSSALQADSLPSEAPGKCHINTVM